MRPVVQSGVCVNQWSGGYNVSSTMKFYLALLSVVILHCCAAQSPPGGRSVKGRLLEGLLSQYETDVEPPEGNTTVFFYLALLCAAPHDDLVSVETLTQMYWRDSRLSWDPEQFDGVRELRFKPSRIWKPDIRLYNAVNTKAADTMAIAFSDGNTAWFPPVTYETRCEHVEDSRINCTLKFGSWTYDGWMVELMEGSTYLSLENYTDACPMLVENHETTRNVEYYDCCPEPYMTIDVNLELAWRQGGHLSDENFTRNC